MTALDLFLFECLQPLNPNPDSQWLAFFKDNEVLLQIDKDCRYFYSISIVCSLVYFLEQQSSMFFPRALIPIELSSTLQEMISKNITHLKKSINFILSWLFQKTSTPFSCYVFWFEPPTALEIPVLISITLSSKYFQWFLKPSSPFEFPLILLEIGMDISLNHTFLLTSPYPDPLKIVQIVYKVGSTVSVPAAAVRGRGVIQNNNKLLS